MLDLKWPWRVDHQILIRPGGRLAYLDCAEYGGFGPNLTNRCYYLYNALYGLK